MKDIAILVHGCHVEADMWEDIIWGNPVAGQLGRASRALLLFKSLGAKTLYWGSGASEKDGLKEAEYTLQYSLSRASELGFSSAEIETIKNISHVDTEAQGTPQEIQGAMSMCVAVGIDTLMLVSSPTHISRCLVEAEKLRAEGAVAGVDVFATASDTCYAGSTPADVLIVEPPHRGDRSAIKPNVILKPIMRRLRDKDHGAEFAEKLEKFMEEEGS